MLGMVLRSVSSPESAPPRRPLTPMMVFTGFLLFGLFNGVSHGADIQNAVTGDSAHPVHPVLYIVATNLFNRRQQYLRLYGLVMVAVFVNSIVAINGTGCRRRRKTPRKPGRPRCDPADEPHVRVHRRIVDLRVPVADRRVVLPIAAPVVIVYLISERRAAFVACSAPHRDLHRPVLDEPPYILAGRTGGAPRGCAYTGAFWNSAGSLGFPAQAVKTVIAPDQLNQKDESSDAYREAEKTDIIATIRSSQFLGIGFGQKFLPTHPAPGHHHVRTGRIHAAQLGALGMDKDGHRRVRGTCSSSSAPRCGLARDRCCVPRDPMTPSSCSPRWPSS